ncbi:ferredoxin reductase-like protein [Daedalea quercina L-15889]|uniref:NADH-cytochrome b5 reductase n=1 Tax=Daedalea quercina L-15889 TaxID=1314783 RepID=A0A165KVI6_9APHY|nr:ferredoxin reductase-like protein [Daedalea quercina L-15889]
MSFIRAATSARATRFNQLAASARRYASTESGSQKSSNLPLILGGAGIAGLAGYIYLNQFGTKSTAVPAAGAGKSYTPAANTTSPLDPSKFIDLPLQSIEPYNHNCAIYSFGLPDGQAALLPVASCVYLEASENAPNTLRDEKGNPVHRPYTPISPSDYPGEVKFLIKRYESGKMSQYIHNLKLGEPIAIKGPLPKLKYEINKWDEVGMIAGGSGITPMYQIVNYALSDPSNKTKFTLIFANVEERDILLRDEFDALKKKHPDTFNVIYTLDKPSDGWKGYKGYVNKELVMQHIAPPSLAEKVKVFICGPPGQVNAIAGKKDGMKQGSLGGILKELGYTEDQVFKF